MLLLVLHWSLERRRLETIVYVCLLFNTRAAAPELRTTRDTSTRCSPGASHSSSQQLLYPPLLVPGTAVVGSWYRHTPRQKYALRKFTDLLPTLPLAPGGAAGDGVGCT
jgi:hypothetical protein